MRKSFLVFAVGVALLGLGIVLHADPVSPAGVEVTCLRDSGSSSPISQVTFYQGDTLTLTNSVMYTGDTTNSPVQNLDGCTITVRAGQPGQTNITQATGYVISTNAGTWGAEFEVPSFNPTYIEVTVSNQAVFTYPRYRITTQSKLGE